LFVEVGLILGFAWTWLYFMAQLKREIKLFIVRSLAVFNTPTETANAVQEEFGIKVTPQKCEAYDPTKRTGKDLSKEFVDEFNETRKQFKENLENIPIANKVYRLQKMQNIINANSKNSMLVLTALEQAAKEVGGAFTNQVKKEISGPDGKPVEVKSIDPIEAAKIYADLMK
jgi:hypothetical protein